MKTFLMTVAALALFCFVGQARAQDNAASSDNNGVSFQTFYDSLANQGTWIQTDQYGYVWQPTETNPDWRPYTYGHWVNSDQGMTWVGDDSFSWATDHYGRWVNLDGYGWVWVPGYTWAPAWVSWREDDQDVGWAPLPPDSDQGIDYYNDDDYFTDADFGFGFHIGDDCDIAYGIGPWWYNFCPIVFIGDRDCWRHFHDRRDNFGLIGRTRNVTNINFRRDGEGRFGHVRAEGPSAAALNARSRTPIQNVRLASASDPRNAGVQGNSLAVFAPSVNRGTIRDARPSRVGATIADARVNRGTNAGDPPAVNASLHPAGLTSTQVHAAALAQENTPATARVATPGTRISRPLTQPLTSMRATTGRPGFSRANTPQAVTRVSPSGSTESRFMGETFPHATMSSSAERAFTGETSPGFTPRTTYSTTPALENRGAGTFGMNRPSASYYHPSTPSYYHSTPSYSHSAPSYYHAESAPVFHSSAPAFHSAPGFSSPATHFGGGAPASHFGGGGGGFRSAGGFSGGGHVSSGGGGHAGGGGFGHR